MGYKEPNEGNIVLFKPTVDQKAAPNSVKFEKERKFDVTPTQTIFVQITSRVASSRQGSVFK